MSSFEQIFLPQPSTKCVQFIFFHLLSLKFSFPDSFIDWLFKRIVSPSEPVLKRQAAAGYLCGLCARAEYISKTTIREVVKLLSNFCKKVMIKSYASQKDIRADPYEHISVFIINSRTQTK